MTNINFKSALIFSCLISAFSISSQSIEWTQEAFGNSSGTYTTQTADNSYLQAREQQYGKEESFSNVAKYDSDGTILWESNVCSCTGNGIKISKELADGNLVHLSNEGVLYHTNSEGYDSYVAAKIIPDSLISSGTSQIEIHTVREIEGGLYVLTTLQHPSRKDIFRTKIDLDSLVVTSEIDMNETASLIYLDYNSETNETVELAAEGPNGESIHFYTIYDDDGQFVNEVAIDGYPIILEDIILTSDRSVFIIGTYITDNINDGSLNGISNAFIRKYDSLGNILFERIIGLGNDEDLKGFQKAKLDGDKLIAAGLSTKFSPNTITPDSRIYVHAFDANTGSTIWKIKEDESLEHKSVSDVLVLKNDKILVTGLSDVTETTGSGKAFLMKLSTELSSNENLDFSEINLFPNPSQGIINITDEHQDIRSIELLDPYSRILHSQKETDLIDLQEFPTGAYLIKLNTDRGSVVRKIMKI